MSYGILSYQQNSSTTVVKNISQTMLGGRVFVKLIEQEYTNSTINIPIPNVIDHTYLKFYVVEPGSYAVSAFTDVNTGLANVKLTPRARFGYPAIGIKVLVFATKTQEPEYGLLSVNDSNERLVSSIYTVPQFLEKITFSSTASNPRSVTTGRTITTHTSNTQVTQGSGRTKIILYTIPQNAADCWYYMDSWFGTGTGSIFLTVEGPTGSNYLLPEAYVFALDNAVPSGETYGLRIYSADDQLVVGDNRKLLFDSGYKYADIVGFATINYGSTASEITDSTVINNTLAILVPGYLKEDFISATNIFSTYYGAVKRIGATIYSKEVLLEKSQEPLSTQDFTNFIGNASNTTFGVSVTPLGGSGSSGGGGSTNNFTLSVALDAQATNTTTCEYNSPATTCNTTEKFNATITGGDSSSVTYLWQLEENTSGTFSISGASDTSTVTVVNNATGTTGTGTTYSAKIKCSATQSNVTKTATYNLNHIHIQKISTLAVSVALDEQATNTTSCEYNSPATFCLTTQKFNATVTGGDNTGIIYSWTLSGNTSNTFSISGASNTSTVTIVNNGSGAATANGTSYSANLTCSVTQSNVTKTATYSLSHNHRQSSVTVTIALSSTGNSPTCQYDASLATSCNTTQTFTASATSTVAGAFSYKWTFDENPNNAFSISGADNLPTVTVINNGTGTTGTGTIYQAKLKCTATQSATSFGTAIQNLSHTHTKNINNLNATVSVSNLTTTCNIQTGSTTCITEGTYTLSAVTGGNGGTINKTWTLENNTGNFSFIPNTDINSNSVTVRKTAGAGNYSCDVRCTVSQTGMTSLVIDKDLDTVHNAPSSGSLVSPVPNIAGTHSTTNTSSDDYVVEATTAIWVTKNGQIWIEQDNLNSISYPGVVIGNWWSEAGTTANNGTANIGNNYWVSFQRTAFSGTTSASSNPDPNQWVSLANDQSVIVSVLTSQTTKSRSASGTYTIKIASTSAGGQPISTTIEVTISASASTTFTGSVN